MATAATFDLVHKGYHSVPAAFYGAVSLLACAGLPLGLFGLANLAAESAGIMPFFFAPFGLSAETGAILHLAQLALIGAAFWAVIHAASASSARFWVGGLGLAVIALPFVTPFLDSLLLAVVCTGLFLLSLATALRAGAASRLAGWLLAPTLAMVGLSAAMGMAVAAFAPPFALTQVEQAPAAI